MSTNYSSLKYAKSSLSALKVISQLANINGRYSQRYDSSVYIQRKGNPPTHCNFMLNFNNTVTRKMATVAMHYPNNDVKNKLFNIHDALNKLFYTHSDIAIMWLLQGAYNSCENFKTAQSFNDFLTTNPRHIPCAQLFTSIETILTTIGYRMIAAEWSLKPHNPMHDSSAHPEQIIMQKQLNSIRDSKNTVFECEFHNLVPPISDCYVERITDFVENSDQKSKNKFHLYSSHKQLTWPGMAITKNIPIRAHTSGSAALSLAALDSIMGEAFHADFFSEKDIKELSAGLIIAAYLQEDFHSLAESACGIFHYISEKQQRGSSRPLTPQQAQKQGLKILCQGSVLRTELAGQTIQVQESMELLSNELITYSDDISRTNMPKSVMKSAE